VEDLWEPWMRHADQALEDDALLLIIQQELAKRCKKSKTRGRKATPADVVLRMLLLKHVRDWSYETLSREVRANLVYREFTRIGGEKVPDDRTMGNLARQLGPAVIEKLHRRVVEIAQENEIATGRKMRVDTTVVETDIHYPTDSTLLGDGVRVLTRIMKKVTVVAGKAGTQMRDRSRSAKLKVLVIARASRNKTEQGRQKMKNAYVKLLDITSRVAGQAKKFSHEIAERVKQGNLSVLHKAKKQLDEMIPRVQQVLRQTRERVLRGNTQADGKLLSVFDETVKAGTDPIRTRRGRLELEPLEAAVHLPVGDRGLERLQLHLRRVHVVRDHLLAEGLTRHAALGEELLRVPQGGGHARLLRLVGVALEGRLELESAVDAVEAGGDHRRDSEVRVHIAAR